MLRLSDTQRRALWYALAAVVGRATGVFLIPVYAMALTVAEAGVWTRLWVVRVVVLAAATLALDSFITQEYHRRPVAERDAYARACLRFVLRWNLPAAVLAVLAACLPEWRALAVTVLGAQAAGAVALALSWLRAAERAVAFALLSAGTGAACMMLSVVLVLLGWKVDGLVWGMALPMVVAAFVLAWVVRGTGSAEGAGGFALRLTPIRVVSELTGQADRLALALLVPEALLGLYDFAARCAGAVGLVLSAAKNAILPAALRRWADGEADAGRTLAEWRWALRGGLILAGALLIAAALLARWNPASEWAASAAFLPGAIALQVWLFTGVGNAVAIYRHRLVRWQMVLPILVVAGVVGVCAALLPWQGAIAPERVVLAQWSVLLVHAGITTATWWRLRATGREVGDEHRALRESLGWTCVLVCAVLAWPVPLLAGAMIAIAALALLLSARRRLSGTVAA